MIPICGIGGAYLRDPSLRVNMNDLRDTLALELMFRGRHATGNVAIDDEGVAVWEKASCSATEFLKECKRIPASTRLLLVHTRYATQGSASFMENNHPIKRGPFFLIHNGHVSNDWELFRKAERSRYGRVDSEAIAALLAYEGDLSRLHNVMAQVEGAAAVAAVDENNPSHLALARASTSPLWVYNGEKIVIFASTSEAIVKAHSKHIGAISTKKLMFMEEGQMWEWQDSAFSVTPFEVKRKYVYTPQSNYRTSYPWEGSLGLQLAALQSGEGKTDERTAREIAEKNERSWRIMDKKIHDPLEVVSCENCGDTVYEEDIEWRTDAEEGINWQLCEECAELWDSNKLDVLPLDEPVSLDEWEEQRRFSFLDGDEDSDLIDDYEGANRSVLRGMVDRWFSI